MHSRGTPETMSGQTDYGDLVSEVLAFLVERAEAEHGVPVALEAGAADEQLERQVERARRRRDAPPPTGRRNNPPPRTFGGVKT